MMMTWLLMLAVVLIAISGLPGLARKTPLAQPKQSKQSRAVPGPVSRYPVNESPAHHHYPAQSIAASLNVVGSALGGTALLLHHIHPQLSHPINLPWSIPLGSFSVAIDDLSLIFLIPIFLISALGSVYGLTYWPQREHLRNGTKLRLCWGLLTASMAMVVLARSAVLFLMAWEIMAVAAFFLVATEDDKPAVRQAAWVYLAAAHLGTLCLFGFFALLQHATGSFDLWPTLPTAIAPPMATALFLTGAVGFALKAGLMPLHVWLPGAHANAPSHVSAILSGVLLKMGVFGLFRVTTLLPHPPIWWGATFLIAGTISAVLGISFAAGQGDLKRLLAYSSIENVGIIVMGLGLATLGRSLDRPEWIVLGLGGALLHLLNHSLFKPLLFMGSGAILHATGTREMDLLGGLGKRMPRTFILFLIGAIAICGLPPLNGFIGELLLYIGFFKTASATPASWGWIGLAAPALALVGALAVASFVKLLSAVFAGAARSDRVSHAHDPQRSMLTPMWFLAACCVLIGIFPVITLSLLDRAILEWAPADLPNLHSIREYVPFTSLTAIAIALLAAITLAVLWFSRRPATKAARSAGTWDCGFARPTSRMEYTGSSFSQLIVELLAWVLWPREKPPRITAVFAQPADFASAVPDLVLDRNVLPAMSWTESFLGKARIFQRGPIQVYMLYILGILILLLLFA